MKGSKVFSEAMGLNKMLYACQLGGPEIHELYVRFLSCLKKAAYAGHPEAQFEYGQQFEDTCFFMPNPNYNPRKSFYWYTKAAENNIGGACNNLGYYYDNGIACTQDKALAMDLYKRAIELGCTWAKGNYRLVRKELNSTA